MPGEKRQIAVKEASGGRSVVARRTKRGHGPQRHSLRCHRLIRHGEAEVTEMSEVGSQLYAAALKEATASPPDFAAALNLLEKAIAAGSGEAAYALSTWYSHGKQPYVPVDEMRAAELLKVAVDAGIRDAMYDLAVSYEDGLGVPQDLKAAFRYFLEAAIRGDAESVFNVGRCLYYGIGTQVDSAQSEIWIRRAEELGTAATEPVPNPRPRKARRARGRERYS